MMGLGIKVAMVSMAMMLYTCQGSSNLYPLILLPGLGGNQLEARLTSEYKPSSVLCNRWYPTRKDKEGWFRIWFDPTELLGPFTECLSERLMLYYHPEMDDYRNAPGVETRVRHFGSVQSLLYLDPHLKHITSYMAPLVKSLEQIGYVEGKTLFGAPYDFRYGLAPKNHSSNVGSKYLQDLKELVEKASNSNGGKPVILLSHSLGCLFGLQFLNRNSLSWREKYIKHFIALAAPWAGTVKEMLTFASGNSLGVPFVDPLILRDEQRSLESDLWLLPCPKLFGCEKSIVITPNTTYSVCDIPKFLSDIGFPQGVHPYKSRVLPLVEQLIAPNVPITCVIGTSVKTPEKLLYGEKGFDQQPEIVYGDGDGAVNMVSLLALESEWANEVNQTVKVVRVDGVSHTAILNDDDALEKIIGEICGINSQ